MKMDEMVALVASKANVNENQVRRTLRFALEALRDELAAAAPESRVSVPVVGVCVVREPAAEGQPNRIILRLSSKAKEKTDEVPPTATPSSAPVGKKTAKA